MKMMLMEYIMKILNLEKKDIELYGDSILTSINEPLLREKMLVYQVYYDIKNNEECLLFLEKIFKVITENTKTKTKKDALTLSIIILKSFLEKKIFNFGEKYINSDDLFNYITDDYEKYLILNKTYLSEKRIQTLVMHVLDILAKKEIIIEDKKKIGGAFYKTCKYYHLPITTYEKHTGNFFSFSFVDFTWLEYNNKTYITTIHYWKTYELNKKNFHSNKSFCIKNKTYFMQKINLKLYVDDEYQLVLQKALHGEVGVLKEKIKNLFEVLNLLYESELWTDNTKNELAEVQKQIARMNNEIMYLRFSNYNFNDKAVIFPLFLDFRGRKYYYSTISPTNAKILRLAYYYGYYDDSDFTEKNNKYSIKYENLLKIFCLKHNFHFHIKFLEMYFWLLIGIGKLLIDKNTYPISTSDFLNAAVDYFVKPRELALEDYLEIQHYLLCFKSFSKKKIKKRVIIKDATASINQIFMKKLGPLNKQSLNYVNLGEENNWYDTYLVFRKEYYDWIVEKNIFQEYWDKEIFNNVLQRKLIKNTIMIIPYSGGFKLCWQNYIQKITKIGVNVEITKELKKFYKSFYLFIKHDSQTKFLYQKNTQTFVNQINKEFENTRKYVLESETGSADISYYKMKKSSIDKKYVLEEIPKRITKLIFKPTEALDIDAFNVSSGANIAHFLDAEEIRAIEIKLGFSILTIHDSYLIDMLNCTKLVDYKLSHYEEAMGKFDKKYEIRNIFIIL